MQKYNSRDKSTKTQGCKYLELKEIVGYYIIVGLVNIGLKVEQVEISRTVYRPRGSTCLIKREREII